MKTADVGVILDEGQWTGYQKLLVAATALTIILDGLDNQLLAAAVPAMMREWHLQRSAFAFVLSSGLFGMMIGGAIGGYIGDRVGRRVALLGSVVSFGALTLLVSFAGGVTTLTALRFFAGLGLGGAMPNAAALSSEYVPLRHRPFAVTLTIVCIPLGGTLAGMTGAQILPHYGWRALFLVGGIVPLLLAALLLNVFNFGGVIGAIGGAVLIGRFGSRITMLAMAAGAIAGAALLASVSIGVQSAAAVLAMLAWTGGLINAVQTTMYALAAHVYPTGIRATGIGTAVAVGRIGGVVSPYAGAWALDRGGPSLMFLFIAGTMTVVFAALASVRNHVPRRLIVRPVRSIAAQPAGR